ncbi:MAG: hypothetical protein ACI4I0_06805, partial [Acutalibacteraceae bacterium]
MFITSPHKKPVRAVCFAAGELHIERQAAVQAVYIDRKIGGTGTQTPTMEREERKDTDPVEFTPYKPKIRKPGTGCVTMINDHLYEG